MCRYLKSIIKKKRTCPDCGGSYQYIKPFSEEYEMASAYFSEIKPPPPKDLNDWFNLFERGGQGNGR